MEKEVSHGRELGNQMRKEGRVAEAMNFGATMAEMNQIMDAATLEEENEIIKKIKKAGRPQIGRKEAA